MNKYLLKSLGVLAVALVTAFAFTACGATDNTAEIDKLKQERDTAITERDTAIAQRDTAQTERDSALAGKNDALNQMSFYKTVVDALSNGFQTIIDATAEAKNAPAEIKELFGLVADVLQNAKDGEITTENVGTLREIFAGLFTPKFTELYGKIEDGETGYESSKWTAKRWTYPSNATENIIDEYFAIKYEDYGVYSCTVQIRKEYGEFRSVSVENSHGDKTHIYVQDDDGDIAYLTAIDVACYTNGTVEYGLSYNSSVLVKNGELVAVGVYEAENTIFTFAEGTYRIYVEGENIGCFVGDTSVEYFEDGNDVSIRINGGELIHIGDYSTVWDPAMDALEAEGVDFSLLWAEPYAEAANIYLADGYDGLIAAVEAKIEIMEQIMAKILELAAA